MALVYEFETREEAERCLTAVNYLAMNFLPQLGYLVIDEENAPIGKAIVNKNAATGESEHNKQHTTSWSVIEEKDGKYYFASLGQNPKFAAGTEQLLGMGFKFVEKDYPDA